MSEIIVEKNKYCNYVMLVINGEIFASVNCVLDCEIGNVVSKLLLDSLENIK